MGSSAQNSSSVHWCRCWVRFNEVPEKVPKVPEKVWEALVQSQVTFNRVPEKVPERLPEKVWEALVQNQVRFNRVPEKVRKKVPEVWEASVQSQVTFNRVPGAEPGQVQQGTGEGSGEGLGGFGAEPGQVQHGSGKGSGEGLGGFGGKPGQVQQDLQPFNPRKPSWGVSSTWLGSTLQKYLCNLLEQVVDLAWWLGSEVWHHHVSNCCKT